MRSILASHPLLFSSQGYLLRRPSRICGRASSAVFSGRCSTSTGGGPLHGRPGDPDLLQVGLVRGLVLLNLRCVRDSNPPLPSVTMPRLCPAYVLPTPRFCILMRLICPLHVDTLLTCALSCACYCIPFLCVSFGPVFFAPLPSVPFRSVSFHFIPFRFVRSVPLRPFRFVPHCSLVPPLALFHSVPFRFVLIRSPRSVRFGSFCSALFGSAPLHSARFRIFRSARSRPAPARLVPFFLLRLLRSVTSL